MLTKLRSMFSRTPVSVPQKRRVLTLKEALTRFSIVAANQGGGISSWSGSTDDFNREYVNAIRTVIQRAQDLDINNPDVHGFHRQRTAQCIGRGISWKASIRPDEVQMDPKTIGELNSGINRLRDLHSIAGGFDATGAGRTETKLQEIAFLTHLVQGTCLVHRVWKNDGRRLLPLALELIPGYRLETPLPLLGDPLISWGIRYKDDRRTEIIGYYVRKPNRSIGANAFIWDYQYDFLPAEDVALLRVTEIAGLDRSLPMSTSLVRMLRNKGEFIEATLASARAQAKYFGVMEGAPGQDPYTMAADDAQQAGTASDAEPVAPGLITLGDIQLLYTMNGEKFVPNTARLPDPDFTGFMTVADARCARGFNTSISRFTRKVESSYSGGRQEEQQDEPVVDQLRESFSIAWQRVHEWFMDAVFINGNFPLPNYGELRPYFCWPRIMSPGKEHINPVDTAKARSIGYALRTLTPQQACEQDGKDLNSNLQEWGVAIKLVREVEKEFDLPEGTLDFLLEKPAGDVQKQGEVAGTVPQNGDQPSNGDAPDNSEGNGNGKFVHRLLRRFTRVH